MTVHLDTSVLIDVLRGHAKALAAVRGALESEGGVAASTVVKVEVLAGMRPHEEEATRQLLRAAQWLPVDDAVAERAGLLANQFLPSHPGVDPVDHVIAATAQLHGAQLWTRNRKHFPMLADLVAPY